jgi:acetylornithine deacetylase/succinyl-diaminopimelate desuccinylase family protein
MNADSEVPVVKLTRELVGRASENPPGNERAVAEWIAERLETSSASFSVETTDVFERRPNVVARAGNPERGSLLLAGHTDVVPADESNWTTDPYNPTVRSGRVVGRGTADMKGAIAAMVVAAERYLDSAEDPGEVILAFVVDEEHGGNGMQHLVDDGVSADAAVIGEPTGLNVCTAIKGVARYEVSIHGESCHSGQPDEGQDAMRGLKELLSRIEDLDAALESTSHEVLAHEDVTVTEVSGGLAPNVVADRADVTIDWRFLPGTTEPDPFDERLRSTLADLCVNATEFPVDIDRTVFARAGETEPDHPIVTTVIDAAHENGINAALVGFNAATDARFLIHDAKIPTVHFGPGSITEDAHTVDESIAVSDLTAAVAAYEAILESTL